MRIAIVQFPGSNCERETMLAVKRAGMEPLEFLWNQPANDLSQFDGYIIVGGFSYEDRSRSGIIAALDPIMRVIKQQSECGKPILGICNGAQILVESGLVPGLSNYQLGMTLTDNKRVLDGQILGTGYYNAWAHIRLTDDFQYGAFTRNLTPKNILHIPVAHGEGRFVIPPALLLEMQNNGLNIFQYCDASGNVIDEFPINPNGSINNIAAVTNKSGNVMAIMPHPERSTNGDALFTSMHDYIAEAKYTPEAPLYYQPRITTIKNYTPPSVARELIIELIITDNHALSVKNELHRMGAPVEIKRQIHWEIECDSAETYEKILQSGVLFNNRKESIKPLSAKKLPRQIAFLVHAKEDMLGNQKQQICEHQFGITGIHAIRHSVLWQVEATDDIEYVTNLINHTHILYNPYAHDCYYY